MFNKKLLLLIALSWFFVGGAQADERDKAFTQIKKNLMTTQQAQAQQQLYQLAHQHNHAPSQALLADMYYNGYGGVEKNVQTAQMWYEKAAVQDFVPAQIGLGGLHLKNGDAKQGAYWLNKAAKHQHVLAQTMLGWLYLEGKGVAKDETTARQLFEQAAKRNYPPAQYALGRFYWAENEKVARFWLNRSAMQGDKDAKRFLNQHPLP